MSYLLIRLIMPSEEGHFHLSPYPTPFIPAWCLVDKESFLQQKVFRAYDVSGTVMDIGESVINRAHRNPNSLNILNIHSRK
jgi:hypothetical protein